MKLIYMIQGALEFVNDRVFFIKAFRMGLKLAFNHNSNSLNNALNYISNSMGTYDKEVVNTLQSDIKGYLSGYQLDDDQIDTVLKEIKDTILKSYKYKRKQVLDDAKNGLTDEELKLWSQLSEYLNPDTSNDTKEV